MKILLTLGFASLLATTLVLAQPGASILIEWTKPQLNADSSFVTTDAEIEVEGRILNAKEGLLFGINGKLIEPNRSNEFSFKWTLEEGTNNLILLAMDQEGRKNQLAVRIIREPKPDVEPDEQESGAKGSHVSFPIPAEESDFPESISIYAVVVGISDYSRTNDVGSLKYAAKDARAYYDFLISPMGGMADPQNVKLLVDQDATALNIKKSIRDMLFYANDEDVFIFYYSGHGQAISNNTQFCLLSSDVVSSSLDDLEFSGVTQSALQDLLNEGRPQKKLMFIDACNSGLMMQSGHKSAGSMAMTLMKAMDAAENTLTVITSASGTELSYEDDELGGGHGVFTYFLIQGMCGEADRFREANRDNLVQVGELYEYLRENVDKHVMKTRKMRQRPDRLLGNGIGFPVSIVGSYDLDKIETIKPTEVREPSPNLPPLEQKTSDSELTSFTWKEIPTDTLFGPADTENTLKDVLYRSPDRQNKFTVSYHHSNRIVISGIAQGKIFNGSGQLKGLLIDFTDTNFDGGMKSGMVQFSPNLKSAEITIIQENGTRLSAKVERMGIPKRNELKLKRFINEDQDASATVYYVYGNKVSLSGFKGGQIFDGRGTLSGDVIDWVDNGKGFECSGRFILNDDWTELQGIIESKEGGEIQLQLSEEKNSSPLAINGQAFEWTNRKMTLSFYGQNGTRINVSGKIDDHFIDARCEIHGDVITFDDKERVKRHQPGRWIISHRGTKLRGKILFEDGTGHLIELNQ